MLRLDGLQRVAVCEGITRRDFLHAGSLATIGLTLSDVVALETRGAAENCIYLFLEGGPSQLDTWDMKPDAPAEIRGPYRPIATNVAGIRISNLFPRMAGQAHRFSLVRSLHHRNAQHGAAQQWVQTGRPPLPGLAYPPVGSVVGSLAREGGDLPGHILLSGRGQSAGFLGKTHEPLLIQSDPSDPGFRVRDLLPPDYVSAVRVHWRNSFRQIVDESFRSFEAASAGTKLLDANFDQAYRILSSTEARGAFDIDQEPPRIRDRYGRNRFGQSCLLARRLVERGVRFVTVNMFEDLGGGLSWDIHGTAPFSSISALDTLGPMFDSGFSSLIEDLADRGLLPRTLVVATGEFGRTPKINPSGGRDHNPACGTVILAGGGIAAGQVVGSSDSIGAEPRDRPIRPEEVVATVYHALGISLNTNLPGPQNRPIPIVDVGVKPIQELFGTA
ncbi:MAG: DUF1501 domain-containing protein [Acidobacteria bacterium]|nr:MAG: DUF1501 domain-containing protein [Acidobacteriota bacterium]